MSADIDAIRAIATDSRANAATLRDLEAVTWANDHFPGITDVRRRPINRGSTTPTRGGLIGDWHGLPLKIVNIEGGSRYAEVAPLCGTCGQHSGTSAWWPLSGAGDVLAVPEGDLAATIDECYHCTWLLAVQAQARAATSRWSRFWFNFARPYTAEDILATAPGDPIPISRPNLY